MIDEQSKRALSAKHGRKSSYPTPGSLLQQETISKISRKVVKIGVDKYLPGGGYTYCEIYVAKLISKHHFNKVRRRM